LEGFWDDFWKEKCTKTAQTCFSRKPEKHRFSQGKIDIFKVLTLENIKGLGNNGIRN